MELVIHMFMISSVRHTFPEKSGFTIHRKNGHPEYTFLHFYNSVELLTEEGIVTTQPHAVLLYAPKQPQYYRSETPLLHDWFHFTGDLEELPLTEVRPGRLCYPKEFSFLTALTAEIESEHYGTSGDAALMVDLKLRELFLKLERSVGMKEQMPVNKETLESFRWIRGEVFSSLERKWTVEDMAQRLSLSVSRFHALYRSIFGISPVEDLINARMDAARNLLSFHDDKIEEISLSLGYENVTHFIRQFKSRNGMTPSQYRKQSNAVP